MSSPGLGDGWEIERHPEGAVLVDGDGIARDVWFGRFPNREHRYPQPVAASMVERRIAFEALFGARGEAFSA